MAGWWPVTQELAIRNTLRARRRPTCGVMTADSRGQPGWSSRCGAQKWLLPENGRPYQRLWPEWRDRMSPLPEPWAAMRREKVSSRGCQTKTAVALACPATANGAILSYTARWQAFDAAKVYFIEPNRSHSPLSCRPSAFLDRVRMRSGHAQTRFYTIRACADTFLHYSGI